MATLTGCSSKQELILSNTNSTTPAQYTTITFEAIDGLTVSANFYKNATSSEVIVLCHQARFNKFEYDGIAQRLNTLGYNCLAIDQRSGGPIAKMQNETYNRAVKKGMSTDYLNAIPDIQAAIDYASSLFNKDVILWGSSYSSTLVLWEALDNEKIKAVVAFSPGDYFDELGSLTDSLSNMKIPMFLTCAEFEADGLDALLSKTTLKSNQVKFIPEKNGHHGSRALWPHQTGGEQYWGAITAWLNQLNDQ